MNRVAAEALLYQIREAISQCFHLNALQNVVNKGVLEQEARFFFGHAPLLHVKQGVCVEFSHG